LNHVNCNGSANGNISINTTGGTGIHNYTWLRNNEFFSTEKNIYNLQPATYQVIVNDTNNCSQKSQTYEITQPDILTIKLIRKINNVCFGEKNGIIEILVEGGTMNYTYSWTSDNGYNSNQKDINNLAAGVYTLIVKDARGCISSFITTMTQNEDISIDVYKKPTSCYGSNDASIKLPVTGGTSP